VSGTYDDDLLAPELTEADDATGFDQPWNPWSLVTLTFFFGLLAGGGLLAFNFDRLGMPGRRVPTLALAFGATTLLIAGALFGGWGAGEDRGTQQAWRWGVRGISVLIAMAIAAPQQKRWRIFEASGLPAGKLLRPAVVACAIALVYEIAWAAALGYVIFFRR
jgi:hypothetical protein